MTKEEVLTKLKEIKPGKNYPECVEIKEETPTGPMHLRFLLQSYYVGMYMAVHIQQGGIPQQCGDRDNRRIVANLKRDIRKALDRGADIVDIGPIRACVLELSNA